MIFLRNIEQSLGGNATNIQTSTTKSTSLFNASSLESELSSLNSSDVASRASTDDYDIVLGLICEEEPHAVGKVSGGDKGLEHLLLLFFSSA